MAKFDLELPTLQNWSCHNCGGCCKQHTIDITEEEKKRIESQGWETDPATADKTLFVTSGKSHRLAQQPDGACVFLNEEGLCRIHAKYGEPAKPLACRIYPYAFHPSGDDIAVSLRFSCPSVVENLGTPVEEQVGELQKIAKQVVPDGFKSLSPPLLRPGQQTNWDDFQQFIGMLDAVFAEDDSVLLSILRILNICNTLDEAKIATVTADQFTELLQLLAQGALAEVETVPSERPRPKAIARRLLRVLVAQYTRHDTLADASAGFRGYWNRLKTSVAFTTASGNIPAVRDEFQTATFASIEESFTFEPGDKATIDEMLTRYFRVKIQGIHFCGAAFYNIPALEGLRSLLLVYPSVMWLARWHAAGESRRTLNAKDVLMALTVADHNHGYSEVFGLRTSRFRVRALATMQQIEPLSLWYSK